MASSSPVTPPRTLITAALPYANGPLHIGHLAGVHLPADIYARFKRLTDGPDRVLYVCGSDEHGVAITIKAQQEGLTPQALIDRYHAQFQDTFQKLSISFDVFDRTSSPTHHQTAQRFFQHFYHCSLLEERETEQFYDPERELFLPDRYLVGTCPVCHFERAYGDQCENCGSSLDPNDLINPRSALSGAVPEKRTTTHWYLPLDAYQSFLQAFLDAHPDWKPNVRGYMANWLNQGLRPRAITRDLDWGVPVPEDIPGAEGKKLYVWFDAPLGYLTATQTWATEQGTPEAWRDWWLKGEREDTDPRLVHFLGKDNIVFHCLIFPAMLRAYNTSPTSKPRAEQFVLPWNVPANEFLNLEGQKISTSRNWAIWLHEFVDEHPDQVDVLRFVLASLMPETGDADFTWDQYITLNNNVLVATIGNFVNRVVTLIHKYTNGVVYYSKEELTLQVGNLKPIKTLSERAHDDFSRFRFKEGLRSLVELARQGNIYLQTREPWKTHAEDPDQANTVLYIALQYAAALAEWLEPVMPTAAARLRNQLNYTEPLLFPALGQWERPDNFEQAKAFQLIPAGHVLNAPQHLFQKLDANFADLQRAKLEAMRQDAPTPAAPIGDKTGAKTDANEAAPSTPTLKPEIEFPDFEKLDLRVATIQAAMAVKKADKLLQLTLSTGALDEGGERTVVSGIAQHFSSDQLIGKRVVIVANLKPRKLKGVQSQGMVLMAEGSDGSLQFVQPGDGLPDGSIVR